VHAHLFLLRRRHLLCVGRPALLLVVAGSLDGARARLTRSLALTDIIGFGKILCPNYDKAWNEQELGYHSGSTDYWVGVRGNVYDLTKFYKVQCVVSLPLFPSYCRALPDSA